MALGSDLPVAVAERVSDRMGVNAGDEAVGGQGTVAGIPGKCVDVRRIGNRRGEDHAPHPKADRTVPGL